MKRISDKTRIVLAISVTCWVVFALSACGAKRIIVPLDAAELVVSEDGGVNSAAGKGGSGGKSGSAGTSASTGASSTCLDSAKSQLTTANVSLTATCQQCLCSKCSDEIAAVLKDGKTAINLVTCGLKNKVTSTCLFCNGSCSTVTGILSAFQGPCTNEVCTAASATCSSSSTIADYQIGLTVNDTCAVGKDNPCGHAYSLSDCSVKNCASPTCDQAKVCQ
jgi:hypothetical protein